MNAPAIVSLKKVGDYDPDRVLAAIRSCLELSRPWLVRHLPLNAIADRASRLVGFLASLRRRS